MRCPLCGGDFPSLTGHVHDPKGVAWWGKEITEQVVKVTPQQFEIVRKALSRREPVYKSLDYAAAVDALRSIGIEPVDSVTYRFIVVES